MVMLYMTMKQCITTHSKCQRNHTPLKKSVVYNINAKQRQAGHQHRQ